MIITPEEMAKDVLKMLWETVDAHATPETRDEVAGKVLEAFSGYMFRAEINHEQKT
jgi:hypothetical protein